MAKSDIVCHRSSWFPNFERGKMENTPSPKKANVTSFTLKKLASGFGVAKGIVLIDYLQMGGITNGEYYFLR